MSSSDPLLFERLPSFDPARSRLTSVGPQNDELCERRNKVGERPDGRFDYDTRFKDALATNQARRTP